MSNTTKKLLACAKCYKLHRKCTGETRPCDYCKERKLDCIENPDRKKRGRPKGSKNKYKTPLNQEINSQDVQNMLDLSKKRNLDIRMNYGYNINIEQDPRIMMDYQKRPKIMNENPPQQNVYQQRYPYNFNNIQMGSEYFQNQINYSQIPIYGNNTPQNYQTPNQNVIIHTLQPSQPTQAIKEIMTETINIQENYNIESINAEEESLYKTKIPLEFKSRDLSFIPKNVNEINLMTNKHCSKCKTEMITFKFCPHCGTPRENLTEKKIVVPKMSRKKILSQAILEIATLNTPLQDKIIDSDQQTIWFVVKHARDSNSPLGDLSIHPAIIKQVSPNWQAFLGYKTSETEKSPVSKFVPSNIEISPKSFQKWESLYDYTLKNSTLNFSCEFVLCHKYGILYGVDLQVTTFTKNGLPDTSFIVIKRHWNLMNVNESSQILNHPKIDVFSEKSINEEEDDEPSTDDPNFELLRKVVDHKKLELNF